MSTHQIVIYTWKGRCRLCGAGPSIGRAPPFRSTGRTAIKINSSLPLLLPRKRYYVLSPYPTNESLPLYYATDLASTRCRIAFLNYRSPSLFIFSLGEIKRVVSSFILSLVVKKFPNLVYVYHSKDEKRIRSCLTERAPRAADNRSRRIIR